jgi:hypothetical protein
MNTACKRENGLGWITRREALCQKLPLKADEMKE